MSEIPPGYYPAEGDPPGTVREWDGTQWVGEPIPPPPGTGPGAAGPFDPERYGTVWPRIGASLIDGVIFLVVIVPFILSDLTDALDEADRTGETLEYTPGVELYAPGIVLGIAFLVMVAQLGGTPGKLMLGLRITTEDSVTMPPGYRRAFVRSLPGYVSFVPVVGSLLSLGIVVLCIVWVVQDAERRSLYDRFAGTRVVRKDALAT